MAISSEDRATLVSLAREAVADRVAGRPSPPQPEPDGLLAEHRGCFVTLTNRGRLRGCIGTFHPTAPLGSMIPEMARAAAGDPRFVGDPILPEELDELTVEVSVLSPLMRTDRPAELDVGTHGIYIVRGGFSGCFLPEVATEAGWDAEQFLSFCCSHKAGMPADAWRADDAEVYLFTSEKFDR